MYRLKGTNEMPIKWCKKYSKFKTKQKKLKKLSTNTRVTNKYNFGT